MSYYRIPLPIPSEPSIRFSTTLDGSTFFIELRWNTRDACWFFSIYDYEESPILQGVRVVVAWPLLIRIVDTRRPLGDLLFVDAGGDTSEDPGEELGDRWMLIYANGEEVEAIREAANA